MNKRSGHKRSGRKYSRRAAKKAHKASGHKRTAKKDRRGTHGYRKGSKSKTMKGKKDFTTKKSSKVFNRRKHYQKHAKGSRVVRKPYHMKRGGMADFKEAYVHKAAFHKPGTEVHSQNLNITYGYKSGNTAILNDNGTITAKGLIERINDTFQNDYLDKLSQGSYPQEWLIQGGDQVVLNSSYTGPVKGSFYKNNKGLIQPRMQAELEKNPPLRLAIGKKIADYLKKEGGLASNSPIGNTAQHWADSLA